MGPPNIWVSARSLVRFCFTVCYTVMRKLSSILALEKDFATGMLRVPFSFPTTLDSSSDKRMKWDRFLEFQMEHGNTLNEGKEKFIKYWGQRAYDEMMEQEAGEFETVLMPPWEKFPEFRHPSIWWRMGPGEFYLDAYYSLQAPKFQTRREMVDFFLSRPHRSPMSWMKVVLRDLQCTTDEDRQTAKELLMYVNLFGFDVSFGAFKAKSKQCRPLLWDTNQRSLPPEECFKRFPRATCFALRWYHEDSLSNHELSSLCTSSDWHPIIDLLQNRMDGMKPWDGGSEPYDYMIRHFAKYQKVPAPWSLEEPYSLSTAYSNAWIDWANMYFDDAPTWMEYLETQQPIPGIWEAVLAPA